MRIYSEDLQGKNSRIKCLFSVIVIGGRNSGKKSQKSQSLRMMIPIRSRSPQVMIPNQIIADHPYPAHSITILKLHWLYVSIPRNCIAMCTDG